MSLRQFHHSVTFLLVITMALGAVLPSGTSCCNGIFAIRIFSPAKSCCGQCKSEPAEQPKSCCASQSKSCCSKQPKSCCTKQSQSCCSKQSCECRSKQRQTAVCRCGCGEQQPITPGERTNTETRKEFRTFQSFVCSGSVFDSIVHTDVDAYARDNSSSLSPSRRQAVLGRWLI